MATPDLDAAVRARLRQLRFERGLSLRDLAASTGISAATLSRIETGQRRVTVRQLGVLAPALRVRPHELLSPAPARRSPPAADGRAWEPVGPELPTGRRVYRIEVPVSEHPHLHSHAGHQWIYVLSGRLRLVVEQSDRVLERGEAAEFDTWRPHWLSGMVEPADTLVIFSPAGEPLRPVALRNRSEPQARRPR